MSDDSVNGDSADGSGDEPIGVTLEQMLNEVVACFEMIRRLGVSNEDIVFALDPDAKTIGVAIRTMSGGYYVVGLGSHGNVAAEEIQLAWKVKVAWWNAASVAARDELFRQSYVATQADVVRAELVKRGIVTPKYLN